MIDPVNVTFSADNIHIPNSYQYNRREVEGFIKAARPAHPDCLPLQKRGNGSLLREWATHKAAYLLDYKRERTASVDLNYPQRWWAKALYFVCGSFALAIEYTSEVFI